MDQLDLFNNKEEATISSRDIAEWTGKRHDHVMRDISVINDAYDLTDNSLPKFGESEYVSDRGKVYTQYVMTKKQALILASGYDVILRTKIIDRLEELELKSRQMTLPSKIELAQMVIESENRRLLLEEKVKKDADKVDFAEAVSKTTGSLSMGDFSKIISDEKIRIGRNNLFKFLRENRVLMQNNVPYQRYMEQGLFEVCERAVPTHNFKTKIQPTTYVTAKGQLAIRKLLMNRV